MSLLWVGNDRRSGAAPAQGQIPVSRVTKALGGLLYAGGRQWVGSAHRHSVRAWWTISVYHPLF